jgi:hypothetical protein
MTHRQFKLAEGPAAFKIASSRGPALPAAQEFAETKRSGLNSFMEPTQDNINGLVEAARSAYYKMKSEYDRQQPDAKGLDECWAEAERLHEALEPFQGL